MPTNAVSQCTHQRYRHFDVFEYHVHSRGSLGGRMVAERRFTTKDAARKAVWDRLKADRVARFPFPPHGRIPNFVGAEAAARRLFTLAPWKNAKRLKINPDAPQRAVRAEALRRGIEVYVPTPRLRGGFMLFDPTRIPLEKVQEAAGLKTGVRWAQPVPLDQLPSMDAIVCGSVAVTRCGSRCGKGEGYSDLEYALLRELGHPAVPVATTVHPVQILCWFPREATDLRLSVIVTPEEIIQVARPRRGPRGIDWRRLSQEDLDAMPVLRELKALVARTRRPRQGRARQ